MDKSISQHGLVRLLVLPLVLVAAFGCVEPYRPPCPNKRPQSIPAKYKYHPYYKQHLDVGGIPMVSSTQVKPEAFAVAYHVFALMFRDKPCIWQSFLNHKLSIVLLAKNETNKDVPEYQYANVEKGKREDLGSRPGLGGTTESPWISASSEDLIPSSRYERGGITLIHELAHAMFGIGIRQLITGEKTQQELLGLYNSAKAKELWKDTYSMENEQEYWAVGVTIWFNLMRYPNLSTRYPYNRNELTDYDPSLSAFISQQFSSSYRTSPPQLLCNPYEQNDTWKDPLANKPDASKCQFIEKFIAPLPCDTPLPPLFEKLKAVQEKTNASFQMHAKNLRYNQTIYIEKISPDGDISTTELKEREAVTISSNAIEIWRIVTLEGTCFGLYVPTTTPGKIYIR